ncbi:conserved hypothetical protein [Ricinus communis]|uniref:Uncharacterized protein n=1 Tax=Ricinus communis TaxID=3988 RepID=B9T3L5_RICCO|nr:conserved hypothetical protein [Ricinus communis]
MEHAQGGDIYVRGDATELGYICCCKFSPKEEEVGYFSYIGCSYNNSYRHILPIYG